MKTYWDTSALLDAILEINNARRTFDTSREKVTRCHTLAETFSHLTGGKLGWRMLPAEAARKITEFSDKMTVVSLGQKETLKALSETGARGVRGGAIHPYAAEVNGCSRIITGNVSDFEPITSLEVIAP